MLRQHGVAITHHLYDYEERGGTAVRKARVSRRHGPADLVRVLKPIEVDVAIVKTD